MACEGCGVCAHFCPEGAITMEPRVCGTWFNSSTENGPMVHARLGIAEENSGLLVSLLRREARRQAEATGADVILVDGPPGIGCPVIASTTGCDAVVVVTEPTVSGLHDLERVVELAAFLKVPAMVTINRWDIHPMMAERIREFAREKGMHHLGDIPVDEGVTAAMVKGQPLVTCSDGPAATAIRQVWQQVVNFLNEKPGPLKMAL
jgi:MinD superfamily P-loop ATPase